MENRATGEIAPTINNFGTNSYTFNPRKPYWTTENDDDYFLPKPSKRNTTKVRAEGEIAPLVYSIRTAFKALGIRYYNVPKSPSWMFTNFYPTYRHY